MSEYFKMCAQDKGAGERPIIVCESINQAKIVFEILNRHNYSVGLSTSENDTNSEEINNFKLGARTSLVLVNRGVLGLNVPTATSMLCLKQTKNREIILQCAARMFRKHPDGLKKYFYMIATRNDWNTKVKLLHDVLSLNSLATMKSYCGAE